MSDAPLFQNADEQEAVYAPEGAARNTDQVPSGDDTVPAGVAGAGMLTGGSTSGILPINALPEVGEDDAHADPTVRGN